MITVINFSHPLADEAKEIIKSQYGAGAAKFVRIHVQVDEQAPLQPQVDKIVAQAVEAADGNPLNIDCILLPGLAPVAVLVARALPHANIIRLARQGSYFLPVEFQPGKRDLGSALKMLVYVPGHPAIQAMADGLARAAGIEPPDNPGTYLRPNMGAYLPIALAELMGATRFRPSEDGDCLIVDWPKSFFAEWQYYHEGKLGLKHGWRRQDEED